MGSVENGHACWVHGHFYGILFVDSIFVITRHTTPSGFGQTAAAATIDFFLQILVWHRVEMLAEADVAVDLNLGGGPRGYLVEGCA